MTRVIISKILLIVLFLVCACATIEPMKPIVKEPERLFHKNYKIYQSQDANVGEEIVKVKDYWVRRIIQNKMRSLNDFKLEMGQAVHSGFEGDTYDIEGMFTHKERKLYLIKIPEVNFIHGLTEDGEWAGITVNPTGNTIFESAANLTPEDTRFEFVKETEVDTSQGFINYEIVFTGTTTDAMNFLYREYTSEDLARPAFHQNLTYPINTEIIRFRQTRIKIHEISSESIKYTVLEDGLERL